jgi:hypothetical protein
MNSEIVYLYMYDAGTRFTEEQLNGLLKNQEDFSKYEFSKPKPEEIATFDIPSTFNLKDETLMLDNVAHKFRVQVAIYQFGGFSIRLRYSLSDATYEVLSKFTFDGRVGEFLKATTAKTKKKVETSLSKLSNISVNQFTETYNFYYIEGENKAQLLKKYGNMIVGLMIDEPNTDALDENYVNLVLNKNISYDHKNIFFVGWEGAVMIDNQYVHEHELLIAEIANLQFLEMRIHHNILTERLNSANKILNAKDKRKFPQSLDNSDIRGLNSLLGRAYDSTRNILNNVNDTVFGLGEWYLARVYSIFANEFKLDTWKDLLERDLEAVDDERKYVYDMISVRHEDFLEYIIILLIVIEVLVEVFLLVK